MHGGILPIEQNVAAMTLRDELKGKYTPVIVKSRKSGYVPKGFTVRVRINEFFFTADCESPDALARARKDPDIESIAVTVVV
jgi:hypothetical protein